MNVYRLIRFFDKKIMAEGKNKSAAADYYAAIEKKNEEILDKVQRTGMVFECMYSDAWYRGTVSISVFDDNTAIVQYGDPERTDVLSLEIVKGIKGIVRKYSAELKMGEFCIEPSYCLDGTVYDILLSDGEDCFYSHTDNLDIYNEDSPNAYKLVTIFKEITALLETECFVPEGFPFQ